MSKKIGKVPSKPRAAGFATKDKAIQNAKRMARSAVTGRFVSVASAARRPSSTVIPKVQAFRAGKDHLAMVQRRRKGRSRSVGMDVTLVSEQEFEELAASNEAEDAPGLRRMASLARERRVS